MMTPVRSKCAWDGCKEQSISGSRSCEEHAAEVEKKWSIPMGYGPRE